MKMHAPKNVNRKQFDYTRPKKERPISGREAKARARMILEFIRDHGVTRLPAGWSRVDI